MGALLARATADDALLRAWEEVRNNAYDGGDPSPAVLAFESRALAHLSDLARQLAEGTYVPSPMTRVTIPKPGGGIRELAVGKIIDRVVERSLLDILDPLVDPTCRPGVSPTGGASASATRSTPSRTPEKWA